MNATSLSANAVLDIGEPVRDYARVSHPTYVTQPVFLHCMGDSETPYLMFRLPFGLHLQLKRHVPDRNVAASDVVPQVITTLLMNH